MLAGILLFLLKEKLNLNFKYIKEFPFETVKIYFNLDKLLYLKDLEDFAFLSCFDIIKKHFRLTNHQ